MQWSPRPRRVALIGALALFAAVLRSSMAVGPASSSDASYGIADWGTLTASGSTSTAGFGGGLNAAGDGAGRSATGRGDQTHAVLFHAGALTDLGAMGADSSLAVSVNGAGVAVGVDIDAAQVEHPVRFANGAVTALLPPGHVGVASAINDSGTMVGSLQTGDGRTLAVQYVGDGTTVDLGHLDLAPPDGQTAAMAVNNAGDVVGSASTGLGDFVAARFAGGHATALPRLGANPLNVANALSQSGGYIVGVTQTADGAREAVQYGPGAAAVDLGRRAGDRESLATGVNRAGVAVGVSVDTSGAFHAVMFKGNQVIDLNSLLPPNTGWTLQSAQGINDAGQIAGYGTRGGAARAFILTPPPPPPPTTTTIPDGPVTHAVSAVPTLGPVVAALLRAVSAVLKIRL